MWNNFFKIGNSLSLSPSYIYQEHKTDVQLNKDEVRESLHDNKVVHKDRLWDKVRWGDTKVSMPVDDKQEGNNMVEVYKMGHKDHKDRRDHRDHRDHKDHKDHRVVSWEVKTDNLE